LLFLSYYRSPFLILLEPGLLHFCLPKLREPRFAQWLPQYSGTDGCFA
jgi:hypothetical protein